MYDLRKVGVPGLVWFQIFEKGLVYQSKVVVVPLSLKWDARLKTNIAEPGDVVRLTLY